MTAYPFTSSRARYQAFGFVHQIVCFCRLNTYCDFGELTGQPIISKELSRRWDEKNPRSAHGLLNDFEQRMNGVSEILTRADRDDGQHSSGKIRLKLHAALMHANSMPSVDKRGEFPHSQLYKFGVFHGVFSVADEGVRLSGMAKL
ncbi:hypothetical protein X888_3016 [Burkholderia pseudomallei MSHR4377]|uniref:hypothetical protein n=1 Tax=Burkholderia pseudomallei TaxID=28450 RepID=UPI00053885D7|nr:hypothetical protein [Burkholderia pseudomallei]KGU92681.1 hypothetical protein X888_3016 [Burkholderia pseudomallei MSHR4377]